jgi:hypothetical protein
MKLNLDWWPLMLRSNHEAVRRENFNLRGALSQANAELRKHRLLIGSLQQGHEQTTSMVERVLSRKAEDK